MASVAVTSWHSQQKTDAPGTGVNTLTFAAIQSRLVQVVAKAFQKKLRVPISRNAHVVQSTRAARPAKTDGLSNETAGTEAFWAA